MDKNLMTATLAGGCFWCLEAVFDQVKGVESVESGYTGGHMDNPSYRQVCNGDTGHAEAVQIKYDGNVVSYQDLLNIFFGIHDPTTLNRQGNDIGSQYRSVIFYHNEDQKQRAERYKQELDASGAFNDPIVTAIEPLTNYYPAEDYHQNYFNQHGSQPYCSFVVRPKVEKFKKQFADKLKK